MIAKKQYFAIAWLFVLTIGLNSCIKNEVCAPANNLVITDLYSVDSHGELVITKIDSLTMFIVGREDSLVYDNVKNSSQFSIPLADTLSHLKVVLKLNDAVDTVWLDYRSFPVFRSTECGVINRYEIKEIDSTKNKIWGLYIDNNQVDETKQINLLLVFHPN